MNDKNYPEHHLPADIEQTSMDIISEELKKRHIHLKPGTEAVVKRVIHTTADFDYASSLLFSKGAAAAAELALRNGADIVTDTNMAKAGVSKPALQELGGQVYCYMADPEVAEAAKKFHTTRAVVAMKKAAQDHPHAVFAVGNAPTALYTLCECMTDGFRPAAVIAVPVGFVNVVESKQKLVQFCKNYDVPYIAAMGQKGGSNVAAAICNALLYEASDRLDPSKRG